MYYQLKYQCRLIQDSLKAVTTSNDIFVTFFQPSNQLFSRLAVFWCLHMWTNTYVIIKRDFRLPSSNSGLTTDICSVQPTGLQLFIHSATDNEKFNFTESVEKSTIKRQSQNSPGVSESPPWFNIARTWHPTANECCSWALMSCLPTHRGWSKHRLWFTGIE